MVETIVYLALGSLCMSLRRILSGMKNGCFYAKGVINPPQLEKYIKNIHFIETPAWYIQFGGMFFFVLAIFRIYNPAFEIGLILLQLLGTLLIMMGASAMASYHYQKYINIGAGLPATDPNENHKSEFALSLFGKSIQFWWYRPMYGKRRKYAVVLGFISIAIGVFLLIHLSKS